MTAYLRQKFFCFFFSFAACFVFFFFFFSFFSRSFFMVTRVGKFFFLRVQFFCVLSFCSSYLQFSTLLYFRGTFWLRTHHYYRHRNRHHHQRHLAHHYHHWQRLHHDYDYYCRQIRLNYIITLTHTRTPSYSLTLILTHTHTHYLRIGFRFPLCVCVRILSQLERFLQSGKMIEKGEKQSRNLLVRFVAVGKQVAMCDSVSVCVCVCGRE